MGFCLVDAETTVLKIAAGVPFVDENNAEHFVASDFYDDPTPFNQGSPDADGEHFRLDNIAVLFSDLRPDTIRVSALANSSEVVSGLFCWLPYAQIFQVLSCARAEWFTRTR